MCLVRAYGVRAPPARLEAGVVHLSSHPACLGVGRRFPFVLAKTRWGGGGASPSHGFPRAPLAPSRRHTPPYPPLSPPRALHERGGAMPCAPAPPLATRPRARGAERSHDARNRAERRRRSRGISRASAPVGPHRRVGIGIRPAARARVTAARGRLQHARPVARGRPQQMPRSTDVPSVSSCSNSSSFLYSSLSTFCLLTRCSCPVPPLPRESLLKMPLLMATGGRGPVPVPKACAAKSPRGRPTRPARAHTHAHRAHASAARPREPRTRREPVTRPRTRC